MSVAAEVSPAYPQSYYYLWHLAALGVIKADFGQPPPEMPGEDDSAIREKPDPKISSTAWDLIAAAGSVHPAKVALIDVGVSRDHPNLASRVERGESIDLASHRYGARIAEELHDDDPHTPEERYSFFANLSLSGLGNLGLSNDDDEYLAEIVAEYKSSQGVLRRLIDPETLFASHGTACAGLIVGEPAAIVEATGETQVPEVIFDASGPDAAPSRNRNVLPYFGVDPFSRLVSIRTSFESDPLQFIAAFLYAYQQRADVIVLPRGLPDPKRSRVQPKNELKADLEQYRNRDAADLFARIAVALNGPAELDPHATQEGSNPQRLWKILKHLIVAISRKIPIVCAAGNSGESQMIYPASLAADNNGIIAVGAVTVEGFRSGYSNYGEGLTLVAPSDDGEVFNRHQLRIDRLSPFFVRHAYPPGQLKQYRYSHFSLLTTDLPGWFGYDSGANPWSSLLPFSDNPGIGGGYYTTFGGTSGAAALIGGVCALVQRAYKINHGANSRLNGVKLKTLLTEASTHDSIVTPGFRPLTPDCMNSDAEDAHGVTYFFGAGLPHASEAVRLALLQ